MRERGSILVGVLWCLTLLSVIVVSLLHTARLDLTLARHAGDVTQARYLALAGVEKAKALLALDARDRSRAGSAHSDALFDAPRHFRQVRLGSGTYSVLRRARPDEGNGWVYGVSDEESRLNVNVAETNELSRLPGMTPDVAAAILDWRDEDNAVTPGGAEADYYASLSPPYAPRNGPFQTDRELLMVRGITAETLYAPAPGGGADDGWAPLLTVHSAARNVNAAGQTRVNLQSADEKALTAVRGITPEIARAIVARRGRNQFQTVADLLDVTAAPPAGSPGQDGAPFNGGQDGGPRIISEELFQEIADDVTTDANDEIQGAVNVNTAGVEILACLPGMDRTLAQAVVNYRKSAGALSTVAALLKVPGMTSDILKQVLPRISVRSDTYRILAEGRVAGRDTRRRIEVIVRVGAADVSTLAYREDDL